MIMCNSSHRQGRLHRGCVVVLGIAHVRGCPCATVQPATTAVSRWFPPALSVRDLAHDPSGSSRDKMAPGILDAHLARHDIEFSTLNVTANQHNTLSLAPFPSPRNESLKPVGSGIGNRLFLDIPATLIANETLSGHPGHQCGFGSYALTVRRVSSAVGDHWSSNVAKRCHARVDVRVRGRCPAARRCAWITGVREGKVSPTTDNRLPPPAPPFLNKNSLPLRRLPSATAVICFRD
jgi:hypothetical protein